LLTVVTVLFFGFLGDSNLLGIGIWSPSTVIVMDYLIRIFLPVLCFLYVLKSIMMLEALYQGFYLHRSGVLSANIMDWNWWAKEAPQPLYAPTYYYPITLASFLFGSRRQENDPVLKLQREIFPGWLLHGRRG
jgi:hypothetical protein